MIGESRRTTVELKALLLGRLAARRAWLATLPVRHVAQDDVNGCGIACVAMLAGTSYASAKRVVKRRKRSGLSTCYPDIRFALDALHVVTDGMRRKFTSWDEIGGRAIVAIEQERPHSSRWHWVIFDRIAGRALVWDPGRHGTEGVREDFELMEGRHYMLVRPVVAREGCGRTEGVR